MLLILIGFVFTGSYENPPCIQPNALKPVYSEDELVSDSVSTVTWRETLILNEYEIHTGVNVKSVCLCLRGNVSFAISEIFWRKHLMLKMLTVKYNTGTLTLPAESFSIGNLQCYIQALD